VSNFFLLFIQGYGSLLTPWHPVKFVFSYIIFVIFLVLMIFWKFYKKTKIVDLRTVDLLADRREYLGNEQEDVEKPSVFMRAIREVANRFRS
jgi:amino acid transporter